MRREDEERKGRGYRAKLRRDEERGGGIRGAQNVGLRKNGKEAKRKEKWKE